MPSLALRTVLVAATSANATNAGSLETSADLLNDRINLIAATTLLGLTYGITTSLYFMTTYHLLKKLLRRQTRLPSHFHWLSRVKMERRRTLFYLVYTSILFVLATVYIAGTSQGTIIAYIDNRLYPAGPYQYYVTYMAGLPVMIMTDAASLIIFWMTDALILWRFIMFYRQVPYVRWVIPLPCGMLVGSMVFSTLLLRSEASAGKIFYLSENMILAYYVLSFSLNVLVTVLIVARLYWHKVQLERAFGSDTESPYMNIATLLIESAALNGAWSIAFLVLYALNSPGQNIILATMSHIQVIAPLLIILWSARGKAWDTTTTERDSELDGDGVSARRLGAGTDKGPRYMAFGVPRTPGSVTTDTVGAGTSRNPSYSTVIGGDAETPKGEGEGEGDTDVIELRTSEPPDVPVRTQDPV